mmetsp:Transcript_32476/g.23998  ORF Transcript_32476/g.23998 Transcript_32476/m.23998 type:complete len:153 (+) Transcript_32476:109-567(+)
MSFKARDSSARQNMQPTDGTFDKKESRATYVSMAVEEPLMHSKKKTVWERVLFCCLENYDLTEEEIKYFWKFKENMVQSFNESNEEHERYLRNLYITVFGTNHKKLPEKLITNNWKQIGFQSKNPRTDFRGGGVLSLNCLRYFVKKYPDIFK